jgi:hypothetical protein
MVKDLIGKVAIPKSLSRTQQIYGANNIGSSKLSRIM